MRTSTSPVILNYCQIVTYKHIKTPFGLLWFLLTSFWLLWFGILSGIIHIYHQFLLAAGLISLTINSSMATFSEHASSLRINHALALSWSVDPNTRQSLIMSFSVSPNLYLDARCLNRSTYGSTFSWDSWNEEYVIMSIVFHNEFIHKCL